MFVFLVATDRRFWAQKGDPSAHVQAARAAAKGLLHRRSGEHTEHGGKKACSAHACRQHFRPGLHGTEEQGDTRL